VSEEADDPIPEPTAESAPEHPPEPASAQAADAPSASPPDATDATSESSNIDLVGIEADLDGVQAALTRLADGTYWTDEVTGDAIPAEVLAADPLARRA